MKGPWPVGLDPVLVSASGLVSADRNRTGGIASGWQASDFRWFDSISPIGTAATFVAIVIFLDVFVIALLIERSFDMFRSVLGTWLPFVLIFIAIWAGTVRAAPF